MWWRQDLLLPSFSRGKTRLNQGMRDVRRNYTESRFFCNECCQGDLFRTNLSAAFTANTSYHTDTSSETHNAASRMKQTGHLLRDVKPAEEVENTRTVSGLSVTAYSRHIVASPSSIIHLARTRKTLLKTSIFDSSSTRSTLVSHPALQRHRFRWRGHRISGPANLKF